MFCTIDFFTLYNLTETILILTSFKNNTTKKLKQKNEMFAYEEVKAVFRIVQKVRHLLNI